MDFQQEIIKILKEILNVDIEALEIPQNSEMGDFAFPCFKLAKEFRKAPPLIANELKEKIESDDYHTEFIKKIEVKGAYLNFFIDEECFAKETLNILISSPSDYGKTNIGNGKKIVIDYSAPNIAKPFHVGHLRSTVIGNALYNIYNTLGYSSYGINYLGDWGTQFGKLIVAYKKWGSKEDVEKGGIAKLNELYVRFHKEAEDDDSLNEEARGYLVKMQEGDEEALSLWKWFKDLSLIDFEKVYKKLGMTFDSYKGESAYNDMMMPVVDELREKGLLTTSQGAQIVDLEEFNMPPCLILRSDGGTLYPTRDIAAVIDRYNEFHFEKAIYITASDQNLHFKQWFKVIEMMGFPWANKLEHVDFGLVSFDNSKISTRAGHMILMEDLLNESVNKTIEIMKNNNADEKTIADASKSVGIGAVIFNDLYNSRIKNVSFSWDRILNFEGETGPYVQYTHARCVSILEKAGFDLNGSFDFSHLADETSFETIKEIYAYPSKIMESAEKNEPYIVTRHIVSIAQSFNKFYNQNKVLVEDETIKNSRCLLVFAVKTVLENGLNILGINAPNKM